MPYAIWFQLYDNLEKTNYGDKYIYISQCFPGVSGGRRDE